MVCNRGCIHAAKGLSQGGTWVPAEPRVGFAWLNIKLGKENHHKKAQSIQYSL